MGNKILLLFVALTWGNSLWGQGKYVEETAALESIYETRARAVLNTFLRPNEYTVVISADMEASDKKIQEYRDDLELNFLPGLPLPTEPSLMPANEHLHEMKSKVEVHLILNTDVPPDKEVLIKKVLASKLHLDLASGDVISVERSAFPIDKEEGLVEKLPELSWRMWGLIVLLSLLALAGLVFWATRRAKSTGASEYPPLAHTLPEGPESEAGPSENTEGQDEFVLAEKISKIKGQTLSLADEFPVLVTSALRDFFVSGREVEVTLFLETLGWEVSRRVFESLSPHIWGRVGLLVKDREKTPEVAEYEKAMSAVHRFLLARVLADGARGDSDNPFAFVSKLSKDERAALMKGESPRNLALVCMYTSAEDVAEILAELSPDTQSEIVLETARLSSLPQSVVQSSVKVLQEKLKDIQRRGERRTNGTQVAVQLMRSMAAVREQELMDKISTENPEEALKLRKASVQFVDLPIYPPELVSKAIEPMEIEKIMKALVGTPASFQSHVIGLLPPKKGRMVESDLLLGQIKASNAEIADCRREMAVTVDRELKLHKVDIGELWGRVEKEQKLKRVS